MARAILREVPRGKSVRAEAEELAAWVGSSPISCVEVKRAFELVADAHELRNLFSVIERLVNAMPESDRDIELLYLAHHGEQQAYDLCESTEIFARNLNLFSGVLTPPEGGAMSTPAEKIDTLTVEEKTLLSLYRNLARWDRNCVFTLLQSLAHGRLTAKTDRLSWDRLRRSLGLPKRGKEAAGE